MRSVRERMQELRQYLREILIPTEREALYWLRRWDNEGWQAVSSAYSVFTEWDTPRWMSSEWGKRTVRGWIFELFQELEEEREELEKWEREEEERWERIALGE